MKLGKVDPVGKAAYFLWMAAAGAEILRNGGGSASLIIAGVAITHYLFSTTNTEVEDIRNRLDKIEPRENEVELKVTTND